MRNTLIMIAASLALLLSTTETFAHAQLQSSSPSGGETVAPPPEIRLTFSEGVEPRFTKVAITGPSGSVRVGAGRTEAGHPEIFITPVQGALAPGIYKVHWQAVSVDTHHSQGSFQFTVR